MTLIAGYKIGTLLGHGAFGETYEAVKSGERVALKLIKEEAIQQGYDVRRFQREVRALQKAVGPHVVRFIDAGVGQIGNETRYFVALEYLQGQDLGRAFKMSGNVFGESDLRRILTQIIAGLETVHAQNIVHRDLKPANVFLTESGDVKLLDFGLVKMLDYTTLTTRPGQPIGTPLYIAPEILRGDSVDFRADFYSLGILIYHLVTRGNYPFAARTPLELYAQVVNNPPIPPTRHNRLLSSEFENLILTLLAKQPYERPSRHDELRQGIQTTPVNVSQPPIATTTNTLSYAKRCFFHLLQTEKADVEEFVKAGGKLDSVIYPAHFLPRYKKSLEAFRRLGVPYLFDPMTYRLPYSSFAQTQGLVNLPYVPDRNSVLAPTALQSLQEQQSYAKQTLDWQLQWGCSILVAPFHFCRDLNSPWTDIDIKLIEESIAYARSKPNAPPVYAWLCISIEPYTVESNRLALLNRYSRARADGYFFYVDTLDERTNNPLQLRAYLDVIHLFQKLGKPVFACRIGTLGLGFLAAGADGTTSGIASLTTFSESTLLVNRSAGYDMTKKYYIPGLMLTLPVPMAQDILSDNRNSSLRCNCPHCAGASRGLDKVAKAHFLQARSEEIAELNRLGDSSERMMWFGKRVRNALQNCENVRKQQVVALQPGYYSHLRVWQQVFTSPPGGAL
jgi:eukaryotic-like serine/threonine-protein kinase